MLFGSEGHLCRVLRKLAGFQEIQFVWLMEERWMPPRL
jgi:hypothetical protein